MIAELNPQDQSKGENRLYSVINIPEICNVATLVAMTVQNGMWTYFGPPPRVWRVDKEKKTLIRIIGPEHGTVESQALAMGWKVTGKPSSEDE
ncbi:MAG: hypothetical protein ACWGQW_03820 [bacterium]